MNEPSDLRAIALEAVISLEASIVAAEMVAMHKIVESRSFDRMVELMRAALDGACRLLTALEAEPQLVPVVKRLDLPEMATAPLRIEASLAAANDSEPHS